MLGRKSLGAVVALRRGCAGLSYESASYANTLVSAPPSFGQSLSLHGSPLNTLNCCRDAHTSSARTASGLKEFVPKWLRREEADEITPEDVLGKDFLTVTQKPSNKFKVNYQPRGDLVSIITEISERVLFSASSSHRFTDDASKFRFLDACVESCGKRIPNSFLDDLETVGDVIHFFSQPLVARDQILERARDDETKPPNVHVIPDYLTFDKEMELHEGRDVYPNQDIIVSSLRERGKYKSVRKAKCPWEEAQGFDLPVRQGRHKGF